MEDSVTIPTVPEMLRISYSTSLLTRAQDHCEKSRQERAFTRDQYAGSGDRDCRRIETGQPYSTRITFPAKRRPYRHRRDCQSGDRDWRDTITDTVVQTGRLRCPRRIHGAPRHHSGPVHAEV